MPPLTVSLKPSAVTAPAPSTALSMRCENEAELAFDAADYREYAMGTGANATAIAYVELRLPGGGTLFGVGIDKNIVAASLKAVVSGVNGAVKGSRL